jgi:VanZ family protein
MAFDKHNRFLWFGAPAILYMVVIFGMSCLPGDKVPILGIDFGDKIIHLLEFGLLGMLLFRWFHHGFRIDHPYIMAIVIGALYAASDEFHQYFVPGRFCGWEDWFADMAGLILFGGISLAANRKKKPII